MSSCTFEDGTSRSLAIFRTETPFSCIFIMAGLNSFILCLKSNNMFPKRKLEKANKNKCPVSFGPPCTTFMSTYKYFKKKDIGEIKSREC